LAASVTGFPPELSVAGQAWRGDAPHGGPVVPATTVKVVETFPLPSVGIRFEMLTPVQETGMVCPSRATVGWPESLLHSRTVPEEFASKPDPVKVIDVPPFKQVPGLIVRLGGPATVADLASQGCVVVVVPPGAVVVVVLAGAVVVVVLAAVVVVVPAMVVVVVVGVESVVNEMGWSTWVPPRVPNAITQVSPRVTCAAVGGQG
jgi:hypothetical protein